jgi:hypothetical protein
MEESDSIVNYKVPNGVKCSYYRYFLINHKERTILFSDYELTAVVKMWEIFGANPIHYIVRFDGFNNLEIFEKGGFKQDDLFNLIYLKNFQNGENPKELDVTVGELSDLIISYRKKKSL